MLPKSETCSGKRYGRLTIMHELPMKNKKRFFMCKCDCGQEKRVRLDVLRDGSTVSCGCYNRDISSSANKTHGLSRTRIYNTYVGMKGRCLNKNNDSYQNYGGRGIRICDEWMEFKSFYDWAMSNGYREDLSIERIDVNGDYEPSNCTWIDMDAQKRNTTITKRITFNGKTQTMRQWADEIGINISTLCGRFKHGMSVKEAFTHKKYAKF